MFSGWICRQSFASQLQKYPADGLTDSAHLPPFASHCAWLPSDW